MKKILLAASLVFVLVDTTQARNSDWSSLLLGPPGRLTCGQFNKLNKAEKEGALAWALGYVSGMATSYIEDSKGESETPSLLEHGLSGPKLVAEIKRQCLEQPGTYFPLIVEWTYVEETSK